MPITCDIKFNDNEHGTYFAGQTVSGQVTLNLDKQKIIKGIALKVYGFAQVNWSRRSHHGHRHDRRRQFEGREDYFNSITYLLGSEDATGRVTMEPGTYNYNFACAIPEMCPTSFESTNGHIRYLVKVVLERPWKFDETFPVGFTVLKRVDLNTDPSVIKTAIRMEASKTMSAGFFSKKPLTLKACISQNGYVPGQSIVVNALVDNETNSAIKGVRFALNLIATYVSQTPREEIRVEKINLVKIRTEPVDKQSKRNFTEILRVPPTPPSCPDLSKIIKIEYEVDVMAKLAGIVISPSVVIPITVGNIPLDNPPPPIVDDFSSPNDKQAEVTTEEQSNSIATPVAGPSTEITASAPSDPNALPPTYEEAMFMSPENEANSDDGNSNADSSDLVHFAPRYPVLDMTPVAEAMLIDLSTEPGASRSPAENVVDGESRRRTPTKEELMKMYNGEE